MNFWDVFGFAFMFCFIFGTFAYVKSRRDAKRKEKMENGERFSDKHPFLMSLFTGFVAAKAMDMLGSKKNKPSYGVNYKAYRQNKINPNGYNNGSGSGCNCGCADTKSEGRSVYEDLNM